MYSQLAEQFSQKAQRILNINKGPHGKWSWTWFDEVYSNIADATPIDAPFKPSKLVNELPFIQHYSQKTQTEIIKVVVRDMQILPIPAHILRKTPGHGNYIWDFSQEG